MIFYQTFTKIENILRSFQLNIGSIFKKTAKEMKFFRSMQKFIVWFMIFGWLKTSKYRICFQVYPILLLTLVIWPFVLTLPVLIEWKSLQDAYVISLLITISLTHLITVIETIFKSKVQSKFVEKFSFVDQIFGEKVQISFAYNNQNKEIFIRGYYYIFLYYNKSFRRGFWNIPISHIKLNLWYIQNRLFNWERFGSSDVFRLFDTRTFNFSQSRNNRYQA